VLVGLLPGLREVRAPLTAGSLLLAALYVVFADAGREVVNERHVGSGLVMLSDHLGDRGWLVVAAVAAYLLGSVYVGLRNLLVRALAAGELERTTNPKYLDGKKTFLESWAVPFSRPSLRRLGRLKSDEYEAELAHRVCLDIIFGGGKRLLVAKRDFFDDYDRLKAEAEFRDSVTLPGLAFLVVVLLNIELAFWTEVVITLSVVSLMVVLTVQARAIDREANSMHAHAIADGLLSTQFIDAPTRSGRTRSLTIRSHNKE
jgi:hypothetical protein